MPVVQYIHAHKEIMGAKTEMMDPNTMNMLNEDHVHLILHF